MLARRRTGSSIALPTSFSDISLTSTAPRTWLVSWWARSWRCLRS
jgi:hypothetical protein